MTERRRGSLSVLAIPWVVAVRAAASSEFRNERFNEREERREKLRHRERYIATKSRFVQFTISRWVAGCARLKELLKWREQGMEEEKETVEIWEEEGERRGTVFRILSNASSIFQAWLCENGRGRERRSASLSVAMVWILNEGEARRGKQGAKQDKQKKGLGKEDNGGCHHLSQ